MAADHVPRRLIRMIAGVGAAVLIGAGAGCATQVPVRMADLRMIAAGVSPVAVPVSPREAWHLAERYVDAHPGTDVMIGCGDSMLPLYRDRTVLIVERMAIGELKAGMTVIYSGDSGRPVAHVLLERTTKGWRAMGLGNTEPDDTLVRRGNYIGTVVMAFAPTAVPLPSFTAATARSGAVTAAEY